MRTKPSLIINACPYCNSDHDPSNQCRQMPQSPRQQLPEPKLGVTRRVVTRITDASGKLTGVTTERRQEP